MGVCDITGPLPKQKASLGTGPAVLLAQGRERVLQSSPGRVARTANTSRCPMQTSLALLQQVPMGYEVLAVMRQDGTPGLPELT